MKIGIFDSGFGGLSIMHAIVAALPQYDYVYLGDTARAPYGTRSRDAVYRFTRQAVDFLFAQDCALVIFACNTASAEALERLQEMYARTQPQRRLLGVIRPAVAVALQQTKNRRIGVLATEGTVKSAAFVRALTARDPESVVVQSACPLFVPLVENGEESAMILRHYAQRYTTPLRSAGVDTVILGCTHYEFLAPVIQEAVGDDVTLICEGDVVAQMLQRYLAQHPEESAKLRKREQRTFFTTDCPEKFMQLGARFYGAPIRVKKVCIDCSI